MVHFIRVFNLAARDRGVLWARVITARMWRIHVARSCVSRALRAHYILQHAPHL